MGGLGGVTGNRKLFMDTLREKCNVFEVGVLNRHRIADCKVTDRKVTAVIAENTGKEKVRLHCSNCIVAVGRWINNDKVMGELFSQFLEARKHMDPSTHTNPNYTGDSFIIAGKTDAMMCPMIFAGAESLPIWADSRIHWRSIPGTGATSASL